jgi:hypothetical protein
MQADHKKISAEKCKDAGLALVLLGLISYQFWPSSVIMSLTIVFLLAAMTFPPLFRPFAKVWFALSELLGTVVSRILLSAVFVVMVLPVGLIRRAIGKDVMQTGRWKQGNNSVFRVRDSEFSVQDLEHPY